MAIHKTNLRHQIWKIGIVTLIWVLSFITLLFNRMASAEYLIPDNDWLFSQLSFSRLIYWSIIGGVFMGISTGFFEYLFSSKVFSRMGGVFLVALKSLTYILFFLMVSLIGYYGFSNEIIVSNRPETFLDFIFSRNLLAIFLYLLITSLLINSFIYVERIIGVSKFRNLVTGQYQIPKSQKLIFLFLDLKDSTTLAEKWGQKKTALFFQQYYGDLSELILPFGGDLYQYVGDEAVITWKLQDDRTKNFQCVELFYGFKKTIQDRSQYYIDHFDVVPDFKAGAHCGQVTISEIDKYQIDLSYHGDVLNTASRITGQCRPLGKDLILSDTLVNEMEIPESYLRENLGDAQLRGRESYINLYHIRKHQLEDGG